MKQLPVPNFPNIPSDDNRKPLSDLLLSRRQNIQKNISENILHLTEGKIILIYVKEHMSEQTHLLYSILGSEHTLHARQLCHWGAHWNAWRCKLRKVTSSCCSFFWQAQIIRVWQRCDHCRSYHAWDVGFASHKINSLSSLSTHCLGCLRIVGWLHLKAPLESFPNLSIWNQESDYLHTAYKKIRN